jgi:hypothetical protein
MAKTKPDEEDTAGKPTMRTLEKAIKDVESLISDGKFQQDPSLKVEVLNSGWREKWYKDCQELSDVVEKKTLKQRLLKDPVYTEASKESDPSSLTPMLETLEEVKKFLKDSLDDLENQEAAKKAQDEAAKKAQDEDAEKAKDEEPEKELIEPSLPEGVKRKGRLGIRQDRDGYTAVRFSNNLPGDQDQKPSISGTCTFTFKDLRTEEPEKDEKGKPNPEVVNLDDAVIPVNSILVFEPTDQKLCVSEFRGRLLIKKNGKDQSETKFSYDDPGSGKCLTKFVFHCVDSNSRPLDLDSS